MADASTGTLAAELEIFRACADPTRLRLLALLGEGELCVCELVEVLQMPQAKVSRHLAVLRAAGLVRDRRVGTWIHYSLRRPGSGAPQGTADSALWSRLCTWLKGEARQAVAADLARLHELCDCGEVCPPRRVPPVARRQEVRA